MVGCGALDLQIAPSALPAAPRRCWRRGIRPGLPGRRPAPFCAVELGVLGLEGVGDVLEEDQAEDDVLVLGRVHVVAQRVGRGPELRLEAEIGAVAAIFGCLLRLFRHYSPLGAIVAQARRIRHAVVTVQASSLMTRLSLTNVPKSVTRPTISLDEGRLPEGKPECGARAVPARGFAPRSRAAPGSRWSGTTTGL